MNQKIGYSKMCYQQAKYVYTAGPWHMRFFRLGKIRMFQNRMTDIKVSM